jgi:GTP-binding protein Era
MSFRSGFVCILGRPKAGKTTLLNALVGEKLAIISPKPQTTRNRIQGVVHVPKKNGKGGGQIVLIDTPGVHKPDSSLGRKMMVEVREALEG